MVNKELEKIRKIMMEVMGVREKKQEESDEEIKHEIRREMIELRKETRR